MDSITQAKIQELGDLELAILVCLVAQEHCMLSTSKDSTKQLEEELRHTCTSTFGLQPAIIECSSHTTVDDFNEGLLVDPIEKGNDAFDAGESYVYERQMLNVDITSARDRPAGRGLGSTTHDARRIADVIIATNLDKASESVQVQCLELIRSKRIFTRTAMHTASKDFMVLAITSKPSARLSLHLNDLFCMSHYHAREDDSETEYLHDLQTKYSQPPFSTAEIKHLRNLVSATRMTPEIAAYLHSITVFMRQSRYVKGGVTATATRQLRTISKTLAPLHGLNYVPPSLVALAVHKIYPHRLKLATAETERSLQWGSDPDAVRELLDGVTIEDAIEDVLASLETPL